MENTLEYYLNTSHIKDYFTDTSLLPFRLVTFEKGTFINNEADPMDHIVFILNGTLRIYNLREDDSIYQISFGSGFMILGDLEFALPEAEQYLIEVTKKATAIVLPLKTCRKQLENDPVFLMHLLQSVALKTTRISASLANPKGLEERLLWHIQYECNDETLNGVEKACAHLQCSRRQLQRILKKLVSENTLIKTGKGRYRLSREKE